MVQKFRPTCQCARFGMGARGRRKKRSYIWKVPPGTDARYSKSFFIVTLSVNHI